MRPALRAPTSEASVSHRAIPTGWARYDYDSLVPRILLLTLLLLAPGTTLLGAGQPPLPPGETVFHTFSIAAVDPETGESGVAVTTRNPCVGNGVPWVRAGVGAVATQARTRTQYGEELLSRLASGMTAEEALRDRLAQDESAENRQVGVVGLSGGVAQHTGSETRYWAGHRAGPDYAVQGNLLVGPEVVDAVAEDFDRTRGSGLSLADRLISAMQAGQAAGGDARRGRRQSAAVLVADPREGGSRRDDGISTHINVCEHETPIAELRRIHDAVSQKLGYRTLTGFVGGDVLQLRILVAEAGCAEPDAPLGLPADDEDLADRALRVFDAGLVGAVDVCREEFGLSTPDSGGSPPGLADGEFVDHLWELIESTGRGDAVRRRLAPIQRINR